MGLENLKIENKNLLDTIVDEIGELENEIKTKKTRWESAADIIQSLDKEHLTNYIENSLKEWDYRLTYQEMKNKPFYPFIVQATIDLLSDELGDKKIDANWDENDDEGLTLDEWIKNCGWIDNIYGDWTKQIVLIIQKYYKGMEEDWFAGPQFFAKMCSIFKWQESVINFKVKKYDEKKKYPYWFENDDLKKNNTESKEIDWYKINLYDWITIWKYKDQMWYELNIPGVEWEFYAYKWEKDSKATILFWNPVKNSGIWKYVTVERTEWWITVKLKGKNKTDTSDKTESIRTSSESVEKNTTKINNSVYNELIKETEGTLKNYTILSDNANWWYSSSGSFNPEFMVRKKLGTNYDEHVDYKFNFHDFLSSDGKKLEKEKLKETVESKMNELAQERQREKEIKNDNDKFLSNIRWKIYSIEDILWEWYDKDDLTLKAFLSKFDNNKVEIDKDTKIEWNTLILEFDIKWKNKKLKWTIQKIELQEIRNTEWKIDAQLFKKKLAEIINEIVNNYFSA